MYAEALTACKERWARHKQGKEDIFADLPFAGQTEDPVKARKAVLSSKQNVLVVPITFANLEGVKQGVALVDSGATECFIDMKTAQCWGLPTRWLVYPRKIYNVDGMENKAGKITRSCMLRVHKGKKQAHQRFFITSLGNDCVILGYPWLEEFNPEIDWSARTMKGAQVQLELQTLAWQNWWQGQAAIRLAKMQPEWEAGNELIIAKTHFAQEWAIAEREHKGKAPVMVKDLGIPAEYK
jgi:hypothetical protein